MARRKGKPEAFQGPKPQERKRLEGLPQTFDVWPGAARPARTSLLRARHSRRVAHPARRGTPATTQTLARFADTVWPLLDRKGEQAS